MERKNTNTGIDHTIIASAKALGAWAKSTLDRGNSSHLQTLVYCNLKNAMTSAEAISTFIGTVSPVGGDIPAEAERLIEAAFQGELSVSDTRGLLTIYSQLNTVS